MAKGPQSTRRILEVETPALEPMQKTLQETMASRGARRPKLDIGPLKDLLGVWRGDGTGFNMIALPFQTAPAPPAGFNFRVLMNQYSEELTFGLVDEGVLNRGLVNSGSQHDQKVATVDYQQKIFQVDAQDKPDSGGLAGPPNLAIHHEPGLWLYMKNLRPKDKAGKINIARLASIPHGNSLLALGESEKFDGMPDIPAITGLPSGRLEDLNTPGYDFNPPSADPYLAPYKHYIDNPYMGNVTTPGFPGFSPADMNEILRFHNKGVEILKTTRLTVDTRRTTGGVLNAPFTSREADPRSMKSTFWIQKIVDKYGKKRLRLQYSQVVMLHFFHPREDEYPGRAVWPHISIATLEKDTAPCKMKPA